MSIFEINSQPDLFSKKISYSELGLYYFVKAFPPKTVTIEFIVKNSQESKKEIRKLINILIEKKLIKELKDV